MQSRSQKRRGGYRLAHVESVRIGATVQYPFFDERIYRSRSSIFFLRLSGLMSVHTSLMWARHSVLEPLLPASVQPRGFSFSAGQIEYCSS